MGEQDHRIDKKTDSAGENARDSSALHERPPAGEHKPKPETPESAETDELLDDRFQATDN